MQASASYVTGSQAIKVGFQDSWGPYNQNLRANGDLYQNYTTNATTGLPVPSTVTLLATPSHWQDRLNANLGIYGQDVMTFKRATITLGGRYEYISEQVTGQDAQVGRFVNIPAFGDIQMPTWKSFSPRTSIVYDLMGNGKTAIRFGYNRFGVAATTTLASLYDPAAGTIISAHRAVDRQERRRHRAGLATAATSRRTRPARSTSPGVPTNFGVVSLASPDPNLTRPYVDQFNLGVTREVDARRVGVGRVVPQRREELVRAQQRAASGHLLERHGDQPELPAGHGVQPDRRQGRSRCTTRSARRSTPAVQNVDTNDSNVKQSYNAFEFNFQARLPHGARLFGGSATDRTIANTCSGAASNPNFLRHHRRRELLRPDQQRHPVAHPVQAGRHVPAAVVGHHRPRRRSRRCRATSWARRR